MSLMKWTLAMAGTAMGLRYLSDRHRKRLAGTGAGAAQGGLASPAVSPAFLGGDSGEGGDGDEGSLVERQDWQTPDTDLAPGSSAKRF